MRFRDLLPLFPVALLILLIGQPPGLSAYSKTSEEVTKEKYTQAGCTSDPYVFLDTKQRHSAKGNPNSIVTPGSTGNPNQRGIDPVFACRLMKLFEYMESQNCPITINSAQRNRQTCNPFGGACASQGNSCHQYGLAVDVGGNARCLNLVTTTIGRQNRNGRFGLHVAYVENGGYRHLQCVEHLVANASSAGGCRTSCDGKTPINFDVDAGPDRAIPSSGLSDTFRNALYGNQQPQGQQPPPPPQQQLPSQPLTGGQSPTDYFTNNPSVPTIPTTLGTTTATTTSIADQLLLLAYGTTTFNQTVTTTNNATSIPLTIGKNDTVALHVIQKNNDGTPVSVTNGTTFQQPQTFTSSDLNYAPPTGVPSDQGRLVALLMQLRDVLAQMLEIMRPMGIRSAINGTAHSEFHE